MEPNPYWISPEFFDLLIEHARLLAAGLLLAPGLAALLVERLTRKTRPPAVVEAPPPREGVERAPTALDEEPAPTPVSGIELDVRVEAEPGAEPVAEAAPPEPGPAPVTGAPPVERGVGFLRQRLARTSETLIGRIGGIMAGRKVDAALIEELEEVLFTADLGVSTAQSLLERVTREAAGFDADGVRQVLRDAILEKLVRVEKPREPMEASPGPHVVLVLGVNGSGKTTSIGKLAARYVAEGKKVVLGAGDTFRAAAIDQLQVWGERVGCAVIAGTPGGDPAAVAFDTVKAAIAQNADVALIDTAGRLQTKKPLMEELAKIARVLGRDLPGAPHETLLVLDSNTGQNAISQTRLFSEVTELTGLVLTKLDGSAKGGVIVGLADEFDIPVHFVGVGEGIEDLQDFHAEEFVDALFSEN
jgi:fused signal recognition particle receptor